MTTPLTHRLPLVLAALLAASLACCNSAASKSREASPISAVPDSPMMAQRGKVHLLRRDGKELVVEVEIASNDADRSRGLMHRRAMPELSGMIFVFPEESVHAFWMKNTVLALDMMFIGADGTIVGIVESAEPFTTSSRRVNGISKYVLEVNAGFSQRHGVAAGDKVTLEGMFDLQ